MGRRGIPTPGEAKQKLNRAKAQEKKINPEDFWGDSKDKKDDNLNGARSFDETYSESEEKKAAQDEAESFNGGKSARTDTNSEYAEYHYIHFVIDNTISMEKHMKNVYAFLKGVVRLLNGLVREHSSQNLYLGLTFINEPPVTVNFSEGKYLKLSGTSRDENEPFLEKFLHSEVYGGSNDGYENISGAISEALRCLEKEIYNHENYHRISRSLIVISDSNFKEDSLIDYRNSVGLRMFRLYLGDIDNHYRMPSYKAVDGEGNASFEEKNARALATEITALSDPFVEEEIKEVVSRFRVSVSIN